MKSRYMFEEYQERSEYLPQKYTKNFGIFSTHATVFDHGLVVVMKSGMCADGLVNCIELCLRYRNCLLF